MPQLLALGTVLCERMVTSHSEKTLLLIAQGQQGHPSLCSGHSGFQGRHSGVRIPWVLNVPVCKKSSHFGHPLACCVQVDGDLASGHGSERGQTVEQL